MVMCATEGTLRHLSIPHSRTIICNKSMHDGGVVTKGLKPSHCTMCMDKSFPRKNCQKDRTVGVPSEFPTEEMPPELLNYLNTCCGLINITATAMLLAGAHFCERNTAD